MPECKECGSQIVWGRDVVTSGMHPLDKLTCEPKPGTVALDWRSGRAKVMGADDMQREAEYVAKGVTFHESHFATCPGAARRRGVSSAQQSLW